MGGLERGGMIETASLRADALAIVRAGLLAADPERLVAEALGTPAATTHGPGRTLLLAAGKAAAGMTRGARGALAAPPDGGLVGLPHGAEAPPTLGGLPVLHAGHPTPDLRSLAAARRALALVDNAGPGDRVLVLLSGGASALLCAPAGELQLADLVAVTEGLQRSGADIHELNCVRRHLSRIKGGWLAARAAPAVVDALLLSDVVGDAPEVIASGPCVGDRSTYADALAVLARRPPLAGGALAPARVTEHLRRGRAGEHPETPAPGDPRLSAAQARVVGSNQDALQGAATEARRRGYRTVVLTRQLRGAASAAGRRMAGLAGALRTAPGVSGEPVCLLAGGETTVQVRGPGLGGRNQELALAAALELDGVPGVVLLAAGSDGRDGPTDAAGALVDGASAARAAALGLDGADLLSRNDAYRFFAPLHDLLLWGATGTNVMDLTLLLVVGQRGRDVSHHGLA